MASENGASCNSERLDWLVLHGRILSVCGTDGSPITPSAASIFAHVFEEGRPDLPSQIPRLENGDLKFSRIPLDLVLRVDGGYPEDRLALEVSVYTKGLAEVRFEQAYGRADHVIVENTWYPIVSGAWEEIEKTLSVANIGCLGAISLMQYLNLTRASHDAAAIDDRAASLLDQEKQSCASPAVPSACFSGVLYPYQLDGLRWLRLVDGESLGGVLADEMGLGKTVQMAAILADQITEGIQRPSLIVAPATLLENWRRELLRFIPSARVLIHAGSFRTGFPKDLLGCDVVIASYDTVNRDLSLFRTVEWNIVVLDEAQAIKNPAAKRSIAVKKIPRRVSFVVTGTPIENKLSDVWSLVDFAIPGYLGDLKNFEESFANSVDDAASLEPRISPLLLRRRVADVASDLPPRIDIPQALQMTEAQSLRYESVRQEVINEYGKNGNLVALTKLRMFCAHHALLSDDEALSLDAHPEYSPKYERLCEIIEEVVEKKEKVIIFTSFNKMADLLVNDVQQRFGIAVLGIDGRTPVVERQRLVDRFGKAGGSAAMVLNPRAAGTGLNIVAANHVIHYNLEWNPAVEDQASARAHRRGQSMPVTVHRLFYATTVEEVIDERLRMKRELASAAIIGTDGSSGDAADIAKALALTPITSNVDER